MPGENPTISEAIESASSTLQTTDEPTKEVEEPQESEEVVDSEEASEKPADPEPEKIQESDDTPLDEFDPEKLPAELQPLYKNLMKGFTQGRQKDREQVRELEEKLAQLQEQLKGDNADPQQDEVPENMSPEEYIQHVAKQAVTQEKVDAFRDQAISDYNSLDPRLTKDSDTYDPYVDTYVGNKLDEALNQHVEETGTELGFPYKELAQQYLGEWDNYIQSVQSQYLSKQRDLAKKAEKKTAKFNPKGTSSAKAKPSGTMSISDAISAAMANAQ